MDSFSPKSKPLQVIASLLKAQQSPPSCVSCLPWIRIHTLIPFPNIQGSFYASLTWSLRGKAFFFPKSKSLGLKCTISGSGNPPALAHALAIPSKVTYFAPEMLYTWPMALGFPSAATKASAKSCRKSRVKSPLFVRVSGLRFARFDSLRFVENYVRRFVRVWGLRFVRPASRSGSQCLLFSPRGDRLVHMACMEKGRQEGLGWFTGFR